MSTRSSVLSSRRRCGSVRSGQALLALAALGAVLALPAEGSAQESGFVLPPSGDSTVTGELPSATRQWERLQQAEEASRAGDYDTARPLWEQVVESNPYRSDAWLALAQTRIETGDLEGGLEAVRRALQMGVSSPRGSVLVRVAEVLAAGGEARRAVDLLERALAAGYGDRVNLQRSDALSNLRGRPIFDSLLAEAPPAKDRVAGWRRDIDFFVSEARRMHASPDRPAHGERFARLADSLKRAVVGSDDDGVAVGLARLAASLGDGHTWIAPIPGNPESPAELRAALLPVRLYAFRDGLYVVEGVGEAKRWIGARVAAVGGRPADEVLRDLAPYVSRDNMMGLRSTGVDLYLRHTGFLRAVGAADSLNAATLTLSDDGVTRDVTFAAGPHRFDVALPVPPGAGDRTPFWLRDPGTPYWMEPLSDDRALYVQINSIRDRENGPSLSEFARLVRDSLDTMEAEGLVLDVRWNDGGNNTLIRPLIRQLVAWEVSGDDRTIVVIAGRHTFSAGQNLANRLERWTDAIFVGEPTGSRPNVAGERTNLVLPWSGLRTSIANRYWQDSDPGDERPWIAPDVRVEPTAHAYFGGHDPVLEAARALLEGERRENGS